MYDQFQTEVQLEERISNVQQSLTQKSRLEAAAAVHQQELATAMQHIARGPLFSYNIIPEFKILVVCVIFAVFVDRKVGTAKNTRATLLYELQSRELYRSG